MPMVKGKKYSYTTEGKAAAKKAAAKKPANPKQKLKSRTTTADQLRQEAMQREIRARKAGKKIKTSKNKKK